MSKPARFILGALGLIVVLVLVAIAAIPMFLNADSFRARIESTLTKSLGRQVTIAKVDLSLWSGGLLAQTVTIADDPNFSSLPFVRAESVKIGVAVLPLVLHREVNVRGFTLQSPRIQLLRGANGIWNYSSIGGAASKAGTQDAETKSTFPDLTVGHVEVVNGQITVGAGPGVTGTASAPSRVYDQVNLDVKDFAFAKSFPFKASAHLPGDGTIDVDGTAGPLNQQDAAASPFSGHLQMKHVDPLAAGFVDATSGISGLVEGLTLDASWSGQEMHVTKLLVDTPHVNLVRSAAPKAKLEKTNSEGSTMLESLSVDSAEVKNGSVTLTTAGKAGAPAVYQQLNAHITNLTPKSSSPFSVSAQLPGGGSLSANGTAGPFNQDNNAATPVNAKVSLKHVELETSGVLAPDAGINGLTDLEAQVQSNGQTLNATGTAQVQGIKLAKNGRPSAKPVEARFTVAQDERAMTGTIERATISVGAAVINLAGTYQSSGPSTAVNMKVNGNAIPINEIEAFLPAVGVTLPSGSRLQGGSLTTNLTVSGSTANPVISGPIRVDSTTLAGFDLGAKLQTLSRLTGGRIGSATGSGTNIRSLSTDLHEQGGAVRTDKLAVDVAGVGTASGAGSISAGGALDYNLLLKLTGLTAGSPAAPAGAAPAAGNGGLAGGLAGLAGGLIPSGGSKNLASLGGLAGGALKSGIPVAIGGTTSNPTFTPNLRGLASGAGLGIAQGLIQQKTGGANPAAGSGKKGADTPLGNALGGLFGKHK